MKLDDNTLRLLHMSTEELHKSGLSREDVIAVNAERSRIYQRMTGNFPSKNSDVEKIHSFGSPPSGGIWSVNKVTGRIDIDIAPYYVGLIGGDSNLAQGLLVALHDAAAYFFGFSPGGDALHRGAIERRKIEDIGEESDGT